MSKWSRRMFVGCALGVAALLGLAEWAARQVAYPPRRGLQDYHREILTDPAAAGMAVESFACADGTPVLVCRPDPAGVIGPRGGTVRDQVVELHPGVADVLGAAGSENGATLVLLHGRRGRKEDMLPVAARFCALGFRCVLPDLPGHGDHPLRAAGYGVAEAGLPLACLEEAARRSGFATDRAGLWGISMGGSVAGYAAARDPERWRALVVVASFESLDAVVARQCHAWLRDTARGWLHAYIAWRFQSLTGGRLVAVRPAERLAGSSAPLLVAHGDGDLLIPRSAGRALLEASQAREKKWVEVGAGTHAKVLVTPQPLYAEMGAWFLEHLVRE